MKIQTGGPAPASTPTPKVNKQPVGVLKTATVSAPSYVEDMIRTVGYTPEVPKPDPQLALEGLNMKAAQDLTPYGYVPDGETERTRVEGMRAAPMKRSEYNKLSDDQRAAVDFNTALIAAREKDLKSGWMVQQAPAVSPYPGDQQTLFGEGADTGGYAGNVTKLLKKIGYSQPDADLTDFLSLDLAVTAEELANLKLPDLPAAAKPNADAPTDWTPEGQWVPGDTSKLGVAELPTSTPARPQLSSIELQYDLIRKAGEYLSKNRDVQWNPMATVSATLGTPGVAMETPLGWGKPGTRDNAKLEDKDRVFNAVFDTLLNDSTKTQVAKSEAFWGQLKKLGYGEKDIDQLFSYIDERTRWMGESGFQLKPGQNDATVIRELAGLGPAT